MYLSSKFGRSCWGTELGYPPKDAGANMQNVSRDIIEILQYLLPGFVCAWVYYGLTSHKKPSEFERVVQALIFTLMIQSLVFIESMALFCIGKHTIILGSWSTKVELVNVTVLAIVFGGTMAFFVNNDILHGIARKLRVTQETSFPSNWFHAFCTHRTPYIVLHLVDERRVYGLPYEWPSDPAEGHFVITNPFWLTDNTDLIDGKEDRSEMRKMSGVESILINVKDVKWVEFMEATESNNGT